MKIDSTGTLADQETQLASRGPRWTRRALSLAAMAAIAAALGYGFLRDRASRDSDNENSSSAGAATSPQPNATGSILQLSDEKVSAADLHTSIVKARKLQDVRNVPGRLQYNENHYLHVTSPVQGSVKQVHVQPGQQVHEGDVLAVLSSSEIGTARSEVQRRQAELQLAEQQLKWTEEIAGNLSDLLTLLAKQPEVEEVEQTFAGKLLGDYRDDILSAYSKLKLAESVSSSSDPLGQQGFISGRIAQQRRSDREVAAAGFASECEQLRFDCRQRRERARAVFEDARRLLSVSQEHLSALCGPLSGGGAVADEESLNDLTLRAPIDGQVAQRMIVAATRVNIADSMFVLANTDTLWVSAELRESDWGMMQVTPGQEVAVRASAIPDQTFAARIRFVGAEVSALTRSLPVVAELNGALDQLKPGLFVWVTFPAGPARTAPAVPPGSVVSHEGQAFVFIAEDRGIYRRQDVDIGLTTPDWIEIRQGLSPGQKIVDRGSFFLKSELLLEGDEE